MAAINFVKTIDITSSAGIVDKLMLGEEPNNDVYQYYFVNNFIRDKQSHFDLGRYDNPSWSSESASITAKKCKDFGIKTFPNIGAIGFYTPMIGNSKMLIPIHVDVDKFKAPTLAITEAGSNLAFIITDPEDITYDCYRILITYDRYAIEYVTYERALTVPKPSAGTYVCYCIGYLGEGQRVSEDSNEITITV